MNKNTGTELFTRAVSFPSPRVYFFPPHSFYQQQWVFPVPPQRFKTSERRVWGAGPFLQG